MKPLHLCLFSLLFLAAACEPGNPNLDEQGRDLLEEERPFTGNRNFAFRDTMYIPIYSDIYNKSQSVTFNLTATLSIRNTSLRDSLFIEDIDYYDTHGTLVREYLDNLLILKPMQSIEYVIEEDDDIGGVGANFIVNWGARDSLIQPVFQGVMISTHGQQGISFLTDGVSISER